MQVHGISPDQTGAFIVSDRRRNKQDSNAENHRIQEKTEERFTGPNRR